MTQAKTQTSTLSMDVPPPITEAQKHPLYPRVGHDDRARLNFIMACYRMTANVLTPGNQKVYENRVKPNFIRDNQREPATRQEVRQAMNNDPFHCMWSCLLYTSPSPRDQRGSRMPSSA